MKITITADFCIESIKELENDGHTVNHTGWGVTHDILSEDQLIAAIGDSQALFVGYEPVTKKVIDSTGLKIICSIRGGPKANIDTDHATEKGIPVIYTLGREAIPVADFTIGQIISLVRKIVQTDRELHKGKFTSPPGEYGDETDVIWDMSEDGPWESRKGIELKGKNLGVIGFGTVGQEVAKRAVGFGMKVLAYDPFQKDSAFIKSKVSKSDLPELLKNSDIVTIHARSTESNKGMIGPKEFAMMKDGAYFINNARAAIVDEKAMRDALNSGKLGGVALDVFHEEPIKEDDPLFEKENAVLTPHIAGAGHEVVYRHSKMLVDDFRRLLKGERPKAIFNPETLEGFDTESFAVIGKTSDVPGAEKSGQRDIKPKIKAAEFLTLEDIKNMLKDKREIDLNNYRLTPLAADYLKGIGK